MTPGGTLDLADRICLVTGASSGIGREAARQLAQRGASVMAVCRDRARGEAAVAELRAAPGRVELLLADLSSQAEVRRLAAEVRARHDRLHVLIHNAGVIRTEQHVTADGIEETLAVNHLAPFLLTLLLRELLVAGEPARVVTVSSEAHRFGRLESAGLPAGGDYRWARAYGTSKLANILFTRELARQLAGTGVTANCLHPGGVNTGIFRESRGVVRLFIGVARPLLRSPEGAARDVVRLAVAPELHDVTGKYFAKGREKRPSAAAGDDALAARLWAESARLVGCVATEARPGRESRGE